MASFWVCSGLAYQGNKIMSTRRQFLKQGAALALIPLVPAVSLNAHGAGKVPLDDPATQANRADKMGVAASDQICQNCRFYVTSDAGAAWAPCQLFQSRLVAGAGWCAGWVPTA
jgi:hypothetical protein